MLIGLPGSLVAHHVLFVSVTSGSTTVVLVIKAYTIPFQSQNNSATLSLLTAASQKINYPFHNAKTSN